MGLWNGKDNKVSQRNRDVWGNINVMDEISITLAVPYRVKWLWHWVNYYKITKNFTYNSPWKLKVQCDIWNFQKYVNKKINYLLANMLTYFTFIIQLKKQP